MIPRASEIFTDLEERRHRFLATIQALSAEQRSFRPQPEAWCTLEVGHHVVLAEQGSIDALKARKGMKSGSKGFRYRLGHLLLRLILKTGIRVKNPVPAAAPSRDVTLDQLELAWEKARQDLREFLEELKERGLRDAGFKHPIGGPLSVDEVLRFLVGHLDHHLRQLDRIQGHPHFPES